MTREISAGFTTASTTIQGNGKPLSDASYTWGEITVIVLILIVGGTILIGMIRNLLTN